MGVLGEQREDLVAELRRLTHEAANIAIQEHPTHTHLYLEAPIPGGRWWQYNMMIDSRTMLRAGKETIVQHLRIAALKYQGHVSPYGEMLKASYDSASREPEWPHFQGVQGYIAACARAFDEEGWRGQRWVELTPAEFACLMKGMPEVARWKYDGDYRFMGCRLRVRTTSPAAAPKDSPGEAGRP